MTKNKVNKGQRNQNDIIFLLTTFKNNPSSCENEIVEMETDKNSLLGGDIAREVKTLQILVSVLALYKFFLR